jgi:hypothetical protein
MNGVWTVHRVNPVGQLASQSGEKEHDDLMRIHILLALALAAPSLSSAQPNAALTSADPDRTNVARELKALREALAEQQEQTKRQQLEIEKLEQQLAQSDRDSDVTGAAEPATIRMVNTVLQSSGTVPVVYMTGGSGERQESAARDKDSPLSFSIGGVQFTPGGTIDFTSVFRTTNVGSGLGTTFGAIPFNNTVQGQLTEDRLSAQNSKVTLKAKGQIRGERFHGIS